jgi:hypothetical protein
MVLHVNTDDANNRFLRDSPPVYSQSQLTEKDSIINDDLIIVPVMAERLDVTKKESSQEAKIIKESISEIKIAHYELYILKRPLGIKNGQQAADPPIHSDIPTQEEVATLFLRAEVPEILRHYHLKEELVVT